MSLNSENSGLSKQPIILLSPSRTKCANSVIMSLICVFIENQISGHTHGVGMIAAHIPVAYLHESFTQTQQSKIKQVLLGVGGFFVFHAGLHTIAEQLLSCENKDITTANRIRYIGEGRLEQIQKLHTETHGLDRKIRTGIVIGAVGEEIYSRLPFKKYIQNSNLFIKSNLN